MFNPNMENRELMGSVSVFYYPKENIFKDSTLRPILNIYKLISPNRIFLFKSKKENMEFVNYEYGIRVKLYYPIIK